MNLNDSKLSYDRSLIYQSSSAYWPSTFNPTLSRSLFYYSSREGSFFSQLLHLSNFYSLVVSRPLIIKFHPYQSLVLYISFFYLLMQLFFPNSHLLTSFVCVAHRVTEGCLHEHAWKVLYAVQLKLLYMTYAKFIPAIFHHGRWRGKGS